MRLFTLIAAASALGTFLAGSARAAVVTERFNFSATDFESTSASPPPVVAVSGQFTITYDNAVFVMDATTVTFDASTPGYFASIPVSYTYSPSLNGTLNFGGSALGTNVLDGDTDDFLLQIETIRTSPRFGMFALTKQGYDGLAESLTGTVTRVAVVPEPASAGLVAMMAIIAMRRRS